MNQQNCLHSKDQLLMDQWAKCKPWILSLGGSLGEDLWHEVWLRIKDVERDWTQNQTSFIFACAKNLLIDWKREDECRLNAEKLHYENLSSDTDRDTLIIKSQCGNFVRTVVDPQCPFHQMILYERNERINAIVTKFPVLHQKYWLDFKGNNSFRKRLQRALPRAKRLLAEE